MPRLTRLTAALAAAPLLVAVAAGGDAFAAGARHVHPPRCTYPPQPSVLTLSVSASRVHKGDRVSAFGVLFRSRCVISGSPVTLLANGHPLAHLTTSRDGAYSYRFAPAHTETLQAVFAGNRSAAAARSMRIRITVVGAHKHPKKHPPKQRRHRHG